MATKHKAHFTPELFEFLRDLEKHNDRDWFLEHKARYERDVRAPLLAFIAAMDEPLQALSSHFRADPRPVGGSMFRINRDIRFSKDKRPYKTHAAAQFRHETGKDVHAPCFYLHLAPDGVFAGAGIRLPEGQALAQIRDAIAERPAAWQAVIDDKNFRKRVIFDGERLARPPRGYDPAHPLIEELKRKDFAARCDFTEAQACARDFLGRFVTACQTLAPFVRFLTAAVELPF